MERSWSTTQILFQVKETQILFNNTWGHRLKQNKTIKKVFSEVLGCELQKLWRLTIIQLWTKHLYFSGFTFLEGENGRKIISPHKCINAWNALNAPKYRKWPKHIETLWSTHRGPHNDHVENGLWVKNYFHGWKMGLAFKAVTKVSSFVPAGTCFHGVCLSFFLIQKQKF